MSWKFLNELSNKIPKQSCLDITFQFFATFIIHARTLIPNYKFLIPKIYNSFTTFTTIIGLPRV